MRALALLLLLHHTTAFNFFDQEKCVIDYRSLQNMWEYKLMHDLINCTEPHKPPIQNGTEPLKVNLHFALKTFSFNPEVQEFSAVLMMGLTWITNLTWKPADYENLKTVVTQTSTIWAPHIVLINSIEEFDYYHPRYWYTTCVLAYSGAVMCMPQIKYRVKCVVDLKDWPYDAQYCKMEFGSDHELDTRVQLDTGSRALSIMNNGSEWMIKDYKQILDATSEKQLVMKFRLERYTKGLAAIVIYPSIILSLLTFSCLFIDARSNHRLLMISFSVLCHFYFLTDLTWQFPENTKDAPKILLYYRGSFILTSVLVAVSVILSIICGKDVECPNWITSVNDFVLMKVSFLIRPRWEVKIEHAGGNVKDWTDFANVANTLCMLVFLLVYVILYCVFMPQPDFYDDSLTGIIF